MKLAHDIGSVTLIGKKYVILKRSVFFSSEFRFILQYYT